MRRWFPSLQTSSCLKDPGRILHARNHLGNHEQTLGQWSLAVLNSTHDLYPRGLSCLKHAQPPSRNVSAATMSHDDISRAPKSSCLRHGQLQQQLGLRLPGPKRGATKASPSIGQSPILHETNFEIYAISRQNASVRKVQRCPLP